MSQWLYISLGSIWALALTLVALIVLVPRRLYKNTLLMLVARPSVLFIRRLITSSGTH